MINIRQISSSIILFFTGFLVLFLSLHTAHAAQMNPQEGESHTDFHWMDKNMPGSPHYVAYRVLERADLLNDELFSQPEEVSQAYLWRAEQRIDSAKYAWDDKEEQRALTTLYKSFGYIHKAVHTCRETPDEAQESCQQIYARAGGILQQISQQAAVLQEKAVSDRVRSESATLVSHIASFQAQFPVNQE